MATLLLLSSSSFLKRELAGSLGKPLGAFKIAHVINASKGRGVGDLGYLERTREIFRQSGAYFEDLDLDGKTEGELRETMQRFDAVFMNGGSTFYLLKSIRESGFEAVLKERLSQGLVYMGSSAGSYVACPTIEMATWKHQDKYDHYGLNDLTAMNLAPFLVTAHYVPELRDLIKEKVTTSRYPVRILNDDQAILVKDGEVNVLGGEEIRL